MIGASGLLFARCGGVILLVMLAACSGGGKPVTVAKTESAEQAPRAHEGAPPQGIAHREAPAPNSAKRDALEQRLKHEKWHGDLDGIAKRRLLRVLVTPSKLGFHFAGGQMQGAIHRFLQRRSNMVRKLRAQAADEGYDLNRWFNNVEIIASKRIGNETVQYVGNIYKYYLAYKMVTEKDARRLAARQNSANRTTR